MKKCSSLGIWSRSLTQTMTVCGKNGQHAKQTPPPAGPRGNVPTDRFVFIPRYRKCPIFSGRAGIGFDEWEEEVQACMRARHISLADQAFFLYDHLEGEAREEIKYRPAAERTDPMKIRTILRELYGCTQSHVSLQEVFYSRKQQDGESLLEFSFALMSLMGKIKQASSQAIPNAEVMLRDQFIEYVIDGGLRRDLKQNKNPRLACTVQSCRLRQIVVRAVEGKMVVPQVIVRLRHPGENLQQ